MAITATQLNAVTDINNNRKGCWAVKHLPKQPDSTHDTWYVISGIPSSERAKYVTTTRSDSAATQGAAVLTAMLNPAV